MRDRDVVSVYASKHPLVHDKLAQLRDVATPPPVFRALVRQLATLLALEATADLPTRAVAVRTPMGECAARRLSDPVALIPILRAGLGMVEPVLEFLPEAEVWHVGLFRDETTLEPKEYYNRLPEHCRASVALVLDPMLATGGSAARTCEIVHRAGVARIKLLALIAAPEGIERLSKATPEVEIHVGAIDDRLNEIGYIVPGLGDAGDRQFGTA